MNEIHTSRAELETVLNDLVEAQNLLEAQSPYPDGPVGAVATACAIVENMLEAATD